MHWPRLPVLDWRDRPVPEQAGLFLFIFHFGILTLPITLSLSAWKRSLRIAGEERDPREIYFVSRTLSTVSRM